MTSPGTARERGRRALVADITATARRLVAEQGAAALSLRQVARELGLVSSALYRYFPSRDALLTALLVEAYDALGAEAERAAAASAGQDAGLRWQAVCRAVRGWAHAHPHEWTLLHGSPVPGYAAPLDTVDPAVRLSRVLVDVVSTAVATGQLRPPTEPSRTLVTVRVLEVAGGAPPAGHPDLYERSIVLLAALVGVVSYELFGHVVDTITDADAWFDLAMAVVSEGAGLTLPVPS